MAVAEPVDKKIRIIQAGNHRNKFEMVVRFNQDYIQIRDILVEDNELITVMISRNDEEFIIF